MSPKWLFCYRGGRSVLVSFSINILVSSCFFRVVFIYLQMQCFQERVLVFLEISKRGVYFPKFLGKAFAIGSVKLSLTLDI